MKPHYHVAFSTIIAGVLYLIFKSSALSISCLISGIFIDLDHVIDYIREHGLTLNPIKFIRDFNSGNFDRIYLIFHAWECLLILAFISWLYDWNPWITGVLIGFSQHILLDALHNTRNFQSYSLLWRWKKDFKFSSVFEGCPCSSRKLD